MKDEGSSQPSAVAHPSRERSRHLGLVQIKTHTFECLVHRSLDLGRRFRLIQAAERQREIVYQRERVEQSGALKEKAHMTTNARQIFLAGMSDVLRVNANLATVGFEEADHQFESDALASATAAQDAKRFTCIDLERYVVENLSISECFKHVLEFNRGGIAHKAFLGKRKKMAFTRTTSAKMIRSEDKTTLLVAARWTPSEPSSVV